jgi:hypothetical protein
MKYIYVASYHEDGHCIASSNTLDGLFELVDEWMGANEQYNFAGKRISWQPFDAKYGGESFYGQITYECQDKFENEVTIEKINVWEIEFNEK